MKNKILLLLLALVILSAITPVTFAATSANQTITATLGLLKKIDANGGTIASTIDPDTGNLQTAFSPGFRIQTNTTAAQTLDLYATCQGATVQQAIFDQGGTRYIILANTTVVPTDAAITDCKAATPDETVNANAIAYPVTEPADQAGKLVYAWTAPSKWVATLTNKGKTDTALNVPTGAARGNTYSGDDEQGSYQAIVYMAFNP